MRLPVYSEITTLEKELPFLLIAAGLDYEQTLVNRPYGLKTMQVIITESGQGCAEFDNEIVTVKPENILIIFPDDSHGYYPQQEPWVVNWIAFDGYKLPELMRNMHVKKSGLYRIDDVEILMNTIRRAEDLLRNPTTLNKLQGSSLVYDFITSCYNNMHKVHPKKNKLPPSVLDPALTIIKNEYQKLISVDTLASSCDLSSAHFCRLFKERMNQRPTEYINELRINNAKILLERYSSIKLSEVAKRSGFSSESYFCSTFKKIEKQTPQEFREKKA